jgi:hypothetical protein
MENIYGYRRGVFKAIRSKTTVGIYTRCLRTMFNEAIHQGSLNERNITHLVDENINHQLQETSRKR